MVLDISGSNTKGVNIIGGGRILINDGLVWMKGDKGDYCEGRVVGVACKERRGRVVVEIGDVEEGRLWEVVLGFWNRCFGEFYRVVGERVLGKGRKAEVVFGFCLRAGRHVCVKVLKKEFGGWWGGEGRSWEKEREFRGLVEEDGGKEVFVRTWDAFESRWNVYFVSEFMGGGDLGRVVMGDGGRLGEGSGRVVMRRLFKALGFLHGRKVVHRNVKTENLLCKFKREDCKRWADGVKLHDLASAVRLDDEEGLKRVVGSPEFMAPEAGVMTCDKDGKRFVDIGTDSDMWSAGVVLYHILSKELPFGGDSIPEIIAKAKRGLVDGFPNRAFFGVSDEAKSLIKGLLNPIRQKRYTAQTALLHPWFEKNQKPGQVSVTSVSSASKLVDRRSRTLMRVKETRRRTRVRGKAAIKAAITIVRWIVLLIDATPGVDRKDVMPKARRLQYNVATFSVEPDFPGDRQLVPRNRSLVPRERSMTTTLHAGKRKSLRSSLTMSIDSSIGSLTSLTLSDRSRATRTSQTGVMVDENHEGEDGVHRTFSRKIFRKQSRMKQIFHRKDRGAKGGKRAESSGRLTRRLPGRVGSYLSKNMPVSATNGVEEDGDYSTVLCSPDCESDCMEHGVSFGQSRNTFLSGSTITDGTLGDLSSALVREERSR